MSLFGLLVLFSLSGCEIEGGATSLTSPTETPVESPVTPAPPPTAPSIAVETGLRVGLTGEPFDLLPYYDDAADERLTSALSELVFPAPLLPLGYDYVTNGILERVPSVENGDVQINMVEAYLDATGMITSTPTSVITNVQQISVIYRWNPELRWDDGEPLTADDSVFAYELAQQISFGQEAQARLSLLERYEAVDAHTTRAILQPDYTDPAFLTSFWVPLPRHLLADTPAEELTRSAYAASPVGYGPYQIGRRDAGRLRLERNPHWPGPQPEVETLTFIFRDSGEQLAAAVTGGSLDLAVIDQPELETLAEIRAVADSPGVTITYTPNPIWEHLDFNLDVPLLQDIRLRRAIAHAIDRQAMIDTLAGGAGAPLDSWLLPEQWAAAPSSDLTTYAHDTAEANRLLDEMGFLDNDGDGLRETNAGPLVIRLVTTENTPLRQAAAEQISANLASVGIGIEITTVPTSQLYAPDGPLFRREFELALFAWIATPDPRGWERWSCAGVPSETNGWTGNNFPGWCFLEADQAIRTATTTIDREQRRAAYLTQQRLFSQELPLLPLFQRVSITISSDLVDGLSPDPTAPLTWNIAEWRRR